VGHYAQILGGRGRRPNYCWYQKAGVFATSQWRSRDFIFIRLGRVPACDRQTDSNVAVLLKVSYPALFVSCFVCSTTPRWGHHIPQRVQSVSFESCNMEDALCKVAKVLEEICNLLEIIERQLNMIHYCQHVHGARTDVLVRQMWQIRDETFFTCAFIQTISVCMGQLCNRVARKYCSYILYNLFRHGDACF